MGPLTQNPLGLEMEGSRLQEEMRGKQQRTSGAFTGEISLQPREEDWMIQGEVGAAQQQQTPLSYNEALKSKEQRAKDKEQKDDEEEWDGSLLFNCEGEISKGVKVTDIEKGPQIEFEEEEGRRLEKRWQNTLIIK